MHSTNFRQYFRSENTKAESCVFRSGNPAASYVQSAGDGILQHHTNLVQEAGLFSTRKTFTHDTR